MTLTQQIKLRAREIGFDLVGIAEAGLVWSHSRYMDWLAHGYHGAMGYLARPDAIVRRADLHALLSGARSVIVVGMNYYRLLPQPLLYPTGAGLGVGTVARYAWGDDYHEVVKSKLRQLVAFVEAEVGHAVAHKICVDTSAVLEREWAMRAGLGWIGKNTLLINTQVGSWLVLGELLLDMDLEHDSLSPADRCGACTRCIEACPTRCILPGRVLDASRCISYLTIELRDDVLMDLRPLIGSRVFGCDVCQEVCPWNRFARPTKEPAFAPRHAVLDLHELTTVSESVFRTRFGHSALRRAKHEGLARNAALVAANIQ